MNKFLNLAKVVFNHIRNKRKVTILPPLSFLCLIIFQISKSHILYQSKYHHNNHNKRSFA